MLRLIGSFARSIEYLVEGTPDEDGLIQALREPRKSFKKAIRQTAPEFRPLARPKKAEKMNKQQLAMAMARELVPPAPFFLQDEEDDWQDQTSSSGAIYIEDVMKRANS